MPNNGGRSDDRSGGEFVLLGRISGAQGIRGEVKIASFTAAPEDIAAYGSLTDGKGRRFVIERLRPLKGTAVAAQLAGVADRTAAESLTGVELYVERAKLPVPEEDEWYYTDLIGLKVFSPEGKRPAKSPPCTISARAIFWRSSRKIRHRRCWSRSPGR